MRKDRTRGAHELETRHRNENAQCQYVIGEDEAARAMARQFRARRRSDSRTRRRAAFPISHAISNSACMASAHSRRASPRQDPGKDHHGGGQRPPSCERSPAGKHGVTLPDCSRERHPVDRQSDRHAAPAGPAAPHRAIRPRQAPARSCASAADRACPTGCRFPSSGHSHGAIAAHHRPEPARSVSISFEGRRLRVMFKTQHM